MTCTKTGAHVYIVPYNEFVWCDIHMYGNMHVTDEEYKEVMNALRSLEENEGIRTKIFLPIMSLRICHRSRAPINNCSVLHAIVNDYGDWFDKDTNSSTLITNNYRYLGYHGKKTSEEIDK